MLPPKQVKHLQKVVFGVLRPRIGHDESISVCEPHSGSAWFALVSTLKKHHLRNLWYGQTGTDPVVWTRPGNLLSSM